MTLDPAAQVVLMTGIFSTISALIIWRSKVSQDKRDEARELREEQRERDRQVASGAKELREVERLNQVRTEVVAKIDATMTSSPPTVVIAPIPMPPKEEP